MGVTIALVCPVRDVFRHRRRPWDGSTRPSSCSTPHPAATSTRLSRDPAVGVQRRELPRRLDGRGGLGSLLAGHSGRCRCSIRRGRSSTTPRPAMDRGWPATGRISWWFGMPAGTASTARVSPPAGVVLDNVVISHPTAGGRGVTRVAYGGSNYLVVWQDSRDGRTSGQYDIYASRVSPSGVVLDTQGIRLSNPASFLRGHRSPAVASDGRSFMVAWETNITGLWDIRFSRVTGDGTVLDSGGVILSGEGEAGRSPMIASDGTNYLVTWSGSMTAGDIRGKRVSPDGVILDRTSIAVCAAPDAQNRPDVTFDGTNYFAVWQDMRNGWYDVYAARVTPDGASLDPAGVPVSLADNAQDIPATCGRYAQSARRVARQPARRQARARPRCPARLDRVRTGTGNPFLSPGTILSAPDQPSRGIRRHQLLRGLAGQPARDDPVGHTRRAGNADRNGLGRTATSISTASDFQWSPAAAFGGSEYFVTWQDRRFGANAGWADLRVARLDLRCCAGHWRHLHPPAARVQHGTPAICVRRH